MIHRTICRMLGIVSSVMLVLVVFTSPNATAQPREATPPTHVGSANEVHPAVAAADDDSRPTLPTDPSPWVGTMLIIIIAMFLMAAVIGPMVRMELPVESQDDAHGNGHDDHSHASH